MGAVNYFDVARQLEQAGLIVDGELRANMPRPVRCRVRDGGKEKRGWYALHEIRLDDGREVLVGGFGVWQGNERNAQKVELKGMTVTPEQRDAMKQRWVEDRKRAERERQEQARRAARRAQAVWAKLAIDGDSDYLKRKGVGAYGVRFSPKTGALVVPMTDLGGRVHGLQIIRGRQRGKDVLEKQFFPAGLDPVGRFHLIGTPDGHGVILIAEGYATAASLHAATGLPVAVAFTAGNLPAVAAVLRKRYPRARLLICADDDVTQKCHAHVGNGLECKQRVWLSDGPACPHCGQPHGASNAGVSAAGAAALAVDGAWIMPAWADPQARRRAWLEEGRKLNDFNDLHLLEGLDVVRAQVQAHLPRAGFGVSSGGAVAGTTAQGGGEDGAARSPLKPIDSLDELLERFALIYGHGGAVFDQKEHVVVSLGDMRDLCVRRELHRAWAEHQGRAIVRPEEVGFDPTENDQDIRCNLWSGWPSRPKQGDHSQLLELLFHMCRAAEEPEPEKLYQWIVKWLAYPLQHPGAKMKSTVVIHGPQGAGKNMFFECYMKIFGRYGHVIDQTAIEDKFNDWASHKLFLIADEVVARSDLFHVKNRLKAFITGDQIRINPKNLAARIERNHVNLVFLSNEAMPVVLEEDDRRHAVIWTPKELDKAFYDGVRAEIRDGGVAALHHYLLNVDLTGFDTGTRPPMTDAKRELIGLSRDSPSQFAIAFESGDIEGFPAKGAPAVLCPCLSTDLYSLYSLWCTRMGLRSLSQPRFANALRRKHGCKVERKRYTIDYTTKGPSAVTYYPGGSEPPAGQSETDWLGERILAFRTSLRDYRSGELRP